MSTFVGYAFGCEKTVLVVQVVAISVGVVSVAVGIGIPVFYESQIDSAVSVFLPFPAPLGASVFAAIERVMDFFEVFDRALIPGLKIVFLRPRERTRRRAFLAMDPVLVSYLGHPLLTGC